MHLLTKNPIVLLAVVVFVIFATWFITKKIYVERFTTNFNPDDQGMEQTIRGYAYYNAAKGNEASQYFGFPDDLKSEFDARILPTGDFKDQDASTLAGIRRKNYELASVATCTLKCS
jgi:hypothetical protein